ncbi:MAG TPA: hypothetical protein DCQ36_07920, partial [Actinobacteria bacterium]|nr:hypothetical protein [Actinomycetota bacterium]
MSKPRLTAATTALAVAVSTLAFTAVATVPVTTVANAADLAGPWTPVVDASALNNKVYSMLQNGNTVYVGGMFTSAGGSAAASYLASFDATNPSATWQPVTNAALAAGSGYTYVSSMARTGTDLYIGGRFAQGTLNNVAKVALGSGAATGLDGGTVAYNVSGNTERDVEEIAVIGNKVYVGGGFAGVSDGTGTVADTAGIAAWDTTTTNWGALDSGFADDANTAPNTNGMVAVANDLYIGGQFLGGKDGGTTIASKRVIAWSDATSTWSSMNGGFGQGLVASMANSTTGHVQGLFAAGNFTSSDATPTVTFNGLAKWNSVSAAWETISSPSGVSGGSAVIEAMAFDAAGDLYVGGNFTSAGGVSANNIAKWDGTSWSALTCGPINGVNDTVRAILPQSDGSLIIGGFFTNAGGDPLNKYVARYTPGATVNCASPSTGGGGGGPA